MFLCSCLWVWTLLFEGLAACLSQTWFYLSALKFCWQTHLAQKLPLSAPPRELISWLSPALQDMQSSEATGLGKVRGRFRGFPPYGPQNISCQPLCAAQYGSCSRAHLLPSWSKEGGPSLRTRVGSRLQGTTQGHGLLLAARCQVHAALSGP